MLKTLTALVMGATIALSPISPPATSSAYQEHDSSKLAGLWICIGVVLPTGRLVKTSCTNDESDGVLQGLIPQIPIRPIAYKMQDGPPSESPEGGSDDLDTWCGTTPVCHRTINNYTSETKANAVYGDESGVRGTFAIILRTSLNGRQPQWNLSIIHDTGPALEFFNLQIHCEQHNSILPDSNCGAFNAGSPRVDIRKRFNSPRIYGPRLVNDADYYSVVGGGVVPEGFAPQGLPALQGETFRCGGNVIVESAKCYFPST
jgi:hypothetical protein